MILTNEEFLSLFGKPPEDARWIASADAAMWLQDVLYYADRNRKENAA